MSQLPRNPTSMEDKHGIFIGSSFPDFPSPTNGSGKKLMFQKTSQMPMLTIVVPIGSSVMM